MRELDAKIKRLERYIAKIEKMDAISAREYNAIKESDEYRSVMSAFDEYAEDMRKYRTYIRMRRNPFETTADRIRRELEEAKAKKPEELKVNDILATQNKQVALRVQAKADAKIEFRLDSKTYSVIKKQADMRNTNMSRVSYAAIKKYMSDPNAKEFNMPRGAETKRIVVRVPKDFYDKVQRYSYMNGMTMSTIGYSAIHQYFKI